MQARWHPGEWLACPSTGHDSVDLPIPRCAGCQSAWTSRHPPAEPLLFKMVLRRTSLHQLCSLWRLISPPRPPSSPCRVLDSRPRLQIGQDRGGCGSLSCSRPHLFPTKMADDSPNRMSIEPTCGVRISTEADWSHGKRRLQACDFSSSIFKVR